jgi:hypothetical protein
MNVEIDTELANQEAFKNFRVEEPSYIDGAQDHVVHIDDEEENFKQM